jgi:hypothetical protein
VGTDRAGGHGERGAPEQRGEERKRRREGGREGLDRRSYAGFEDGIERAFCAAYRAAPPPAFPVQSRQGIAVRRIVQVGRRPDALLFCDGAHPGAHRWPDGGEVDEGSADRRPDKDDHVADPGEHDNSAERGQAVDEPPGSDGMT